MPVRAQTRPSSCKNNLISKIQNKTDEILSNVKCINNINYILEFSQNSNSAVVLCVIKSLKRIFCKVGPDLLEKATQLSDVNNEDCDSQLRSSNKTIESFLNERYLESQEVLCDMVKLNRNVAVQETAMQTLITWMKKEPLKFSQRIIKKLLESIFTSEFDKQSLILSLQSYFKYKDFLHVVMTQTKRILKDSLVKKSEFFLQRIFVILTSIEVSESEEFLRRSKNASQVYSIEEQKKAFTSLWLQFLRLELSKKLYRDVLMVITEKVIPFMSSPLLLSDFLTESYNIGGAVSLLSLNGIFVLVHQYNLEYPDFYIKLYALLTPQIFHTKYTAKFFFLLDLFMTSTHLPSYIVAAFIKRLARLALTAPPHGALIVIPFIYNLQRRHPSCKILNHHPKQEEIENDPFNNAEPDISKCDALSSSLWEIKSLENHYYHAMAAATQKLDQPLSSKQEDITELYSVSSEDLLKKELKRKCTLSATNYKPPGPNSLRLLP